MPLITFATDFGTDPYPGICRAVIKRLAPGCDIVDLTHNLPTFDPRAGAIWLLAAAPYLPVAIHLGVVDPGVGGARRAVVLACGRGDLLVGPDNGLWSLAQDALGGVAAAWRLENPAWRLHPVSATFHGRDVFAPAAAHLAAGEAPGSAGPAIDPASLVRVALPQPRVASGRVEAEVVAVDPFGSALLGVRAEAAAAAGLRPGVAATAAGRPAPCVTTFADVAPGALCLLADSSGWLLLTRREASAAGALGLKVGAPVTVTFAPASPS